METKDISSSSDEETPIKQTDACKPNQMNKKDANLQKTTTEKSKSNIEFKKSFSNDIKLDKRFTLEEKKPRKCC